MLLTNFGTLADENSELRHTVLRLQDWARLHSDWSVLDPRVVSRDLRDVDPFLLSAVFLELVRKGLYKCVYMVETPSGVLADGEYDDPRSIPDLVPDGFYNYFPTAEAEIVPVFKPTK